MPEHGGVARRRVLAELLLVNRLPAPVRVVIALIVLAACGAAGVALLGAQHALAGSPSRLAAVLGHGTTWVTAWPGWLAALCFLVALVRLRRTAPEPPAGMRPLERLSAADLRSGLLREYTLVRAALALLLVVTMVDVARAIRYLLAGAAGDQLARSAAAPQAVQALGLAAASVTLALWAFSFRSQLDHVGALPGA